MTGHDVGVVAKVALAIATVYIIWRLATEYGITGKVVLILLLALICFFQNKTIVVVVVFLIWCLWCLLPIGEKNRKEKKKESSSIWSDPAWKTCFGQPSGDNNHDHQKVAHDSRMGAEHEAARMQRRYPEDTFNAYYNRHLQAWYVGRSSY